MEASYVANAYKDRRTIYSIGHFHAPYTTAFSFHSKGIPLVTGSSKSDPKEILIVRCETCPSRFLGLCECKEGQRKNCGGVNILLLEGDGFIVLGADIKEVFHLAELVETNAKTAFLRNHLNTPYRDIGPVVLTMSKESSTRRHPIPFI